jgi:ribonuclease HII
MGIDEAGYGPNLGPFVMSAALFHVPEGCNGNLWKTLRPAVRRAAHKPDGRLVVDDSKAVYQPKLGLGVLERNLWPFVQLGCSTSPATLADLWQHLVLTGRDEIDHEPYLHWDQPVPLGECSAAMHALLCGVMGSVGVRLERLRSVIVSPRRFNAMTREADSKAAVPLRSAGQLIQNLPDDGQVHVMVDRLGGRMRYAERMQDWFPGKCITCLEETATTSRYQVADRIEITFIVEADQSSLPVALASMLSKHWRELLMHQFNAWFKQHQAELTPTAGYPGDSTRFWNDVKPIRQRLGLHDDDWWRER